MNSLTDSDAQAESAFTVNGYRARSNVLDVNVPWSVLRIGPGNHMSQSTISPFNRHWYAVRTKSRQEKAAAFRLSSADISHYLPLLSNVRQWSDRKQSVQIPLFPGYLFVHLNVQSGERLEVLKTPGVVGFVGNACGPLPIPDNQIESVRRVASCGKECISRPRLNEGDRVRVVGGALAGIEGALLRFGSRSKLIITIEMIQRSMVVNVSEDDVEPLSASN